MEISAQELNELNLFNSATPGKIAAILDQDQQEKVIFKLDEFDPTQHDLLITQIWSKEQEQLVRNKISFLTAGQVLSHFETLELIRLYEMLLDWVVSVEYSITVSD